MQRQNVDSNVLINDNIIFLAKRTQVLQIVIPFPPHPRALDLWGGWGRGGPIFLAGTLSGFIMYLPSVNGCSGDYAPVTGGSELSLPSKRYLKKISVVSKLQGRIKNEKRQGSDIS
ncbi:hypothetical protein VNO77_24269 [Canavalia gladiata]|uniref:Uncharacterized protein n=1 Tax=Canavalia gladiata TaxID=3824 RepID=A0AAN9LBA6_CANGL